MEKTIDLNQASQYDLLVAKNRTLNCTITCTYLNVTGGTEYFDFTTYTGASMQIKNNAGTILMSFSTSGGSIQLSGTSGIFRLIKTAAEMNTIRAGQYRYDLYLSNATYPKRNFLYGNITFMQDITT
jgi:hypothetical protein